MVTAGRSMDIEKEIERLVEITDAVLAGELDAAGKYDFNGEGILRDLAARINAMIANLRKVEVPLASAGDRTPELTGVARDVLELMDQSTAVVLDKSDRLIELCDRMQDAVAETPAAVNDIAAMKAAVFDIVASQSYQDVARQKMEGLARDLEMVRDWLLEVILVLNLRKDGATDTLKEKARRLVESRAGGEPDLRHQNLVDDLLAEFGL